MLTDGPTDARMLRSRLNHPIIDADGHWLEYAPLMREEFRRIGGDAAAEALAIASDRIPSSLRMSLAERRRRRDRKSTRLNSSHGYISYAVFCLKKKKK